jgi:serine/threonine protein kinase
MDGDLSGGGMNIGGNRPRRSSGRAGPRAAGFLAASIPAPVAPAPPAPPPPYGDDEDRAVCAELRPSGVGLGKGAFGVVTAQTYRGLPVAVKHVRLWNDQTRATFDREARLHRVASRNPFVAEHIDTCAAPGHGILVMERMLGGALMDMDTLDSPLYHGGPAACAVAVVVLRQLLQGLSMMHCAGMAHRDIKPPNVMINTRVPFGPAGFVVKYVDFGLACDSMPTCSVKAGTQRFWPPELWDGTVYNGLIMGDEPVGGPPRQRHETLAKHQDIWALGATVLYFASHGGWDVVPDMNWLYDNDRAGSIVQRYIGRTQAVWPLPLVRTLDLMLSPRPPRVTPAVALATLLGDTA